MCNLVRSDLHPHGELRNAENQNLGDVWKRSTAVFRLNAVKSEKHALRVEMRRQRLALGAPYREFAARQLAQAALASGKFQTGMAVGGYWACGTELDLAPTLRLLMARGVMVYLPKIDGATLVFLRFTEQAALTTGPHGLLQPPDNAEPIALSKLDVALIPLLAVDARGYRLGQGGGYYDRALASVASAPARPHAWGVAFDSQRVARVPTETFDEPLDAVLAGDGLHQFPLPTQDAR
jgi:5-formyltetrahydrofolate cyclo-ligase